VAGFAVLFRFFPTFRVARQRGNHHSRREIVQSNRTFLPVPGTSRRQRQCPGLEKMVIARGFH
jgi:hypothetical protein